MVKILLALAKQYSEDTGSKEQGGKYLVLPWTNSEKNLRKLRIN